MCSILETRADQEPTPTGSKTRVRVGPKPLARGFGPAAKNLLRARTPPGCAAGVGPRPPSNVCGRPQVPANPAVDRRLKASSRCSWSARCLLRPRISAISTTRRSFRRPIVAVSVKSPEPGGQPPPSEGSSAPSGSANTGATAEPHLRRAADRLRGGPEAAGGAGRYAARVEPGWSLAARPVSRRIDTRICVLRRGIKIHPFAR
jgi:hypothetical protein